MYPIRLIVVAVLFGAFMIACGGDDDPLVPSSMAPSSMDRDKFIGSWAGSYDCGSPADTMLVAVGSGNLGFSITLHAQAIPNADVVTGELTEINVITIPEQTIGGCPGSGDITFSNNMLTLKQRGFGITCTGTGYVKF